MDEHTIPTTRERVLVLGVCTAGKSTLIRELQRRGVLAEDSEVIREELIAAGVLPDYHDIPREDPRRKHVQFEARIRAVQNGLSRYEVVSTHPPWVGIEERPLPPEIAELQRSVISGLKERYYVRVVWLDTIPGKEGERDATLESYISRSPRIREVARAWCAREGLPFQTTMLDLFERAASAAPSPSPPPRGGGKASARSTHMSKDIEICHLCGTVLTLGDGPGASTFHFHPVWMGNYLAEVALRADPATRKHKAPRLLEPTVCFSCCHKGAGRADRRATSTLGSHPAPDWPQALSHILACDPRHRTPLRWLNAGLSRRQCGNCPSMDACVRAFEQLDAALPAHWRG